MMRESLLEKKTEEPNFQVLVSQHFLCPLLALCSDLGGCFLAFLLLGEVSHTFHIFIAL